ALSRDRRHQRLQEFVRQMEATLELRGEIGPLVIRVVELVFVLDVHAPAVAGFRQHREQPLPIDRSLAGYAEAPPADVVHRLNSGAAYHVPEDFGVLEVHVVNLVDEVASGLHRVLERIEKRLPAYRAGGDVGSPGVGFPQDANLVLFAHREVLLRVDLDDLIHLLPQGLALDGAGLSPDVRNPQLAAQFEGLDGLLDLAVAQCGVGVDVVPIATHRGGVDAGRLDLVLQGGYGSVVQAVGIELELHAGKAFGLDELQVGVGILAEDAEFGLPTRNPVALRLAGGSRG